MLIRVLVAMVLVASAFVGSPLNAQEQPDRVRRANVVFDLSVELLLELPEFKNASLEELIEFAPTEEGPFGQNFGLSDITRITGAISLPERTGDLAKVFYEKEFPFDFVVHVQFSESEHSQNLGRYLEKQNFGHEKTGDTTVFRVPVTDTQTSVLLRRYGKSSIAFGTSSFLHEPINEFVSPEVRKAWASTGKGPVRLVFDLKNAESFVEEVFQLINFGDVQGQLEEVCRRADAMSISVLPDSGHLLKFSVLAKVDEATDVLQKRLDYLSFELRKVLNKAFEPLSEKSDTDPVAIDGVSTVVKQSNVLDWRI